jgi:eukaryotic-like serine/threonine-protein kinase
MISTTELSPAHGDEDDPRLRAAVQEYLRELESGRRPDRHEFAARFPGLEEAMLPYLDALDMVRAAAPLLHSSSGERVEPAAAEPIPAEPLGDFRIVRTIGRGGMGVVYEAVQRSLGRRVALKVLPFAAALDAKQLQRFQNEAQAAAQLHHPNIVPVYFVGCERGVHFYAMQLIQGQNLAALLEDLKSHEASRGPAANPPVFGPAPAPAHPGADTCAAVAADLSTQRSERSHAFFRSVAPLIEQAATALDYAHGLGIVHRDVKPANLLLDGRGNVWITDFGLAQFHADAGLTQSGDLLGTLRYMSPEQAGGQRALMDHRTDVYSLGATLYELLTLRPIFDGADRHLLLHQILQEEPRPPRSIDRSIPPELETIVLKAVAKAPAERYASAREMADDLQRFREDRPIRARRPSLAEKATKWARRHRPVVASALAALLLTLAALTVTTVLIARAYDRERQKAREADEQRERADENFRKAWQAVNLLERIGEEELAGDPRQKRLRRRLLEAVLAYYQDFIDQQQDDASARDELEASRARVKTIIEELTTLLEASQYTLLRQQAVQNELKLIREQREAIARLDERLQDAFAGFGRLEPPERERQHLVLARDQEAEIGRLLLPGQLRRFKQLVRQQRGPLAFIDPDVVAALQLSPEQKRIAREIQDVLAPDGPKGGPPPGGGKPHPHGDKPHGPPRRSDKEWAALRTKMMKKMLDSLTREQIQKWEELIGDPVAEEILSCPPPPFGAPPR